MHKQLFGALFMVQGCSVGLQDEELNNQSFDVCSTVVPQMERQMSMSSNMMGMQGPTHSSSCSSTHIPSMHSEAKLVSSHGEHFMHVRTNTSLCTPENAGARWCTLPPPSTCCNPLFFFSTGPCQQGCAL